MRLSQRAGGTVNFLARDADAASLTGGDICAGVSTSGQAMEDLHDLTAPYLGAMNIVALDKDGPTPLSPIGKSAPTLAKRPTST